MTSRSLVQASRTLLAGLALVAGTSQARAATVVGTQAIVDLGTTTAASGNINGSTSFTFGNLVTAGGQSGNFATTPGTTLQFLGASTLTLSGGGNSLGDVGTATFSFNTLSPGTIAFGNFVASTYTVLASDPNTQSYFLTGTFSPGALFVPGNLNTPGPASLVINLTQTNGSGAIGASITLASPPANLVVPEPASVAMLGLGLLGVVGVGRLRRKAA